MTRKREKEEGGRKISFFLYFLISLSLAPVPRVGGSWIGLEVNNETINWDPKDITIHGSKESWIVRFRPTKAHMIAT